jgi:hypothetical protein
MVRMWPLCPVRSVACGAVAYLSDPVSQSVSHIPAPEY